MGGGCSSNLIIPTLCSNIAGDHGQLTQPSAPSSTRSPASSSLLAPSSGGQVVGRKRKKRLSGSPTAARGTDGHISDRFFQFLFFKPESFLIAIPTCFRK